MVKEIISKRLMLVIVFSGLVGLKCVGYNSVVDDLLLVVVGAITGKEVL